MMELIAMLKIALPLIFTLLLTFSATLSANADTEKTTQGCPATLDFTLRKLDSEQQVNLCETYQDKLVLVVNTASHCGFTPQFEGLEKIYQSYKDRGFVVLGMPSNDFGSQDPGNEKEISGVCHGKYDVTFPMFEKIHAAKMSASPLYKTLGELAGEYPAWNFHKYMIYKGELIGSFPSQVTPEDKKIVSMIEDLL
ncbi:MAG: glutathione peroxidase [Thiolinea sp.]